jgi:hypothetical protein
LRGDHLIGFGITVSRHVSLGTTRITLVKILIRVVDTVPEDTKADRIVLAEELGKPIGGLNRMKLAIDINAFKLIDQDDRGVR